MNQILRAFSAVVDDVDASERSVVAKISAGDIDRHRTIIASSGVKFENYRRNPVVLFEHGKSAQRGSLPIGRNVWIKADGKGTGRILAKTRFCEDPFSDLLFSFYKDGTMRGWSISILPEEASVPSRDEIRSRSELKDCELIYRSSDLLEYSAVSVPSLSSALSQDELRSLSTLVVRGFWTPSEEVKPLVDPIVERMSESGGMADGGALVDGDDEEDDDDADDAKAKKKKKKRAADDDADAVEMSAGDATGDEVDECYADVKPMRSMDDAEPDAEVAGGEVVRDAEEVEAVADEPVDAVEREAPEVEAAAESDPVEELAALFRRMIQEGRISLDEFRSAPEHEPAPEPVVEPPAPVDPFAGLPPFVGRSIADAHSRRGALIEAFAESARKMFRDFYDWRCGKG